MTEVVVEEQLELVNIIEISQTKLTKNFTFLLRRLNEHDQIMAQQKLSFEALTSDQNEKFKNFQIETAKGFHQTFQKHVQSQHKMHQLQNEMASFKEELKLKSQSIKRLNDELFNTQLQFEQNLQAKERKIDEISIVVQRLCVENVKLSEEVNKKQTKVEVEKISRETEILKQKHIHVESEIKMAHHKLEKIEILNQKAERVQAKKDAEMVKEIQQKFRKQIKVVSSANGTAKINSIGVIDQKQNEELIGSRKQSRYSTLRQKQQTLEVREGKDSSLNSLYDMIDRCEDRLKLLEKQARQTQQNVKNISKNAYTSKKTDSKDNSSEGFNEKINQIKPELIKLWAKFDTLEDRLSFNQRKLDEKLRMINDLANLFKENNMSKLEDKIKILQTEIFTNLKEIRAKIQTKVNSSDYQKYCSVLEDRIVQINEMIYLKSDKLEVKKALLFLEAKIKEIILVISEDEENQKDALLTKKQIKCMSCDKEFDKFNGVVSSPKGNWDSLPYKDHPSQILGRFGMTNFGSLSKKIKKLEGKDLPILNRKVNPNQSFQPN